MVTTIRPLDRQLDLEYFIDTEYDAALEAGMISVDQDEATRRIEHRNELLGFMDDAAKTGIFVAEDGSLCRIGLVWVSERERGEAWDLGPAIAWIYDIRVDAGARRNGLGSRFLMRAESWAAHEGYPMIGLHVFGDNTAARALYAACGYAPLNTYVQVTGLDACRSLAAARDSYRVCAATPKEAADVEHLVFDRFARRARRTWPNVEDSQIRESYARTVGSYEKSERDDIVVLVRDEATDQLAGIARAYASSGDVRTMTYAWMRDLVIAQGADMNVVSRMLLGGIARWASDRGLDAIRTSIHGDEAALLDILRGEGFAETNVFLRKPLTGSP